MHAYSPPVPNFFPAEGEPRLPDGGFWRGQGSSPSAIVLVIDQAVARAGQLAGAAERAGGAVTRF
jgi:hypothetical protein